MKALHLLLIPAACAAACGSVFGFAPGGFKFFPGAKTHVEITEDALANIYAELGQTTVTKSMKAARTEITDANKDVDQDQFQAKLHFDGESFNDGQNRVVALLSDAVTEAQANNMADARKSVGSALHTVQDFYAHSNWIELKNTSPSSELGRPGVITNQSPPGEATCIQAPRTNPCFKANLITSHLTSGYYGGEDTPPSGPVPPAGKCRHSGFFDSSSGLGGINKDSDICIGVYDPGILDSPHNDSNASAASVATAASQQVFEDLRAKLTPTQFKALLGIGPSLGFAIDTTGSMGSVIAGVQASVIGIVNGRLGTPDEPSQYVLSPFNDPSVGPVLSTSDAPSFKDAVNSLFASGGGDCPELAMAGAYNAVDALTDGGEMFLYTDATPKDAALMGAVRSLANSKNIKTFFALFGSCSPYDPAYFALANSTGGQVFILGRSEAGTVTQLSSLLAGNNTVDIESMQATISTPRTIPFSIDSSTSTFTLSYSNVSGTALNLLAPDGTTVTAGTPNVSTIALSSGIVYTIKSPQVGVWKAQISGSGQFSILVSGQSAVSFDEFKFVTAGGRPGHQGYYAIPGLPKLGTTTKAVAKVSGVSSTVTFQYKDLDDKLISSFVLADANAEDGRLIGDTTIPSQSFRIYATGTDPGGAAFQRLISTVVVPQSVAVTPPSPVDLGRGQVTKYIFQVTNSGAATTFAFTANDNKKFVSAISPTASTLSTGQSALVTVTLTVPASAAIGAIDTLTFNAVSTADPNVQNSAVLSSSVVAAKVLGDVNGDGVVNCADLALIKASFGSRSGAPAFNPDVDLDSNGLVDIRDLAIAARQLPPGTVCK